MFKESILASFTAVVAFMAFQNGYAGEEQPRVVKWEISDYKTVNSTKNVNSSGNSKVNYQVSSGDNIHVILSKNNIQADDINSLIYKSKNIKKLESLLVGQEIGIYKKDGKLDKLILHINDFKSVVAVRGNNGFVISDVQTPYTVEKKSVVTNIEGNLSSTLVKSGVSSSEVVKIRKALNDKVNLNKLKNGDKLNLIIEEKVVSNGKILGYGDVIAVEIHSSGVKHSAYLHNNKYFDHNGKSLESNFLRHPIDNVRVTSNFNLARKHPILKKVRPHKGTDYGARTGTPVYAAADGVVKAVGRQNGYGNLVTIKHQNGYETRYAHLSKFGTKRGAKVSKGQVIGYVGSTGYATGPHLHYELIVNGRHVDSTKAKIPTGESLRGDQLAQFKGNVYNIAMQFERAEKTNDYIIASNSKSKERIIN